MEVLTNTDLSERNEFYDDLKNDQGIDSSTSEPQTSEQTEIPNSFTIDLESAKALPVSESMRINFEGLAFVLLLAVRRCFSIGVLVVVNHSPVLQKSGLGFVAQVLALLLSFPFFGTVLSFLPSLLLSVVLVYIYLGICSAYPGQSGIWNLLTAALLFISSFIGAWPTFITTPIFTFFFAPFGYVMYANRNETLQGEVFNSPIQQIANPIVINLVLGWAFSFASCFLIPLPAAFIVSKELKYAMKLISNLYENVGSICATGTTLDLLVSSRCLVKEAKITLENISPLREYAQIELFFTSTEAFEKKYTFLSESLKIIEEMFRIGTDKFGVVGMMNENNLQILTKHVAFIKELGNKENLEEIKNEIIGMNSIVVPIKGNSMEGFRDSDNLVDCLRAINNRILDYNYVPLIQKNTFLNVRLDNVHIKRTFTNTSLI